MAQKTIHDRVSKKTITQTVIKHHIYVSEAEILKLLKDTFMQKGHDIDVSFDEYSQGGIRGAKVVLTKTETSETETL